MNTIELDGKSIKSQSHDYLIEMLELPDYYGKNLDALYDCLTSISKETEIELKNSKEVSKAFIDTFIDAAGINSFLSFKIIG